MELYFFLGTREYMSMGREFWLRMNSRRRYTSEKDAEECIMGLKWVSERLDQWRDATISDPRRFMTQQTHYDAKLVCDGIPKFINYLFENVANDDVFEGNRDAVVFMPKVISQDPLECTFGALRQRCGGTQKISVLGLAYNMRSINCNIVYDFMQRLNIET